MQTNLMICLLTILMMAQYLKTEGCTSGCLSCNYKGLDEVQCKICDSASGFYMENGKCIFKPIHDCVLMNFEGQCWGCDHNHFLDQQINSCVIVPESNQIKNCEFYRSMTECMLCKPGFYYDLNEISCVEISESNAITNCQYYLSQNQCRKCVKGFTVSYDRSECFEVEDKNCKISSVLRCGGCQNQYFNDLNFSFLNSQNSLAQIEIAKYYIYDFYPGVDFTQFACVKQSDPNCVKFLDFNTCLECANGYFLFEEDKKCYEKPKPSIKNCKYFSDSSSCNTCFEGFHLASPTVCKANELIQYCLQYSQTSPSTECTLCESDYYASTVDGRCHKRVKSYEVLFCDEFFERSDQCSKCVVSYQLTHDNMKCLKEIPNCQAYKLSNLETSEFLCNLCNEGFYLDEDNNQCIQPSDYFSSKCKLYARDTSKCEECSKGTYISSYSYCSEHDLEIVTPNCNELSLIDKNTCKTCNEGYFLFESVNNCVELTNLIPKCLVYLDVENCSECEDGYWGTNCAKIPEEAHCLQRDQNGNCTKCEEKYILDNSHFNCQKPLGIVESYCNSVSLNLGTFTCAICKENTYAMSYEYSSYCLEPDFDLTDKCIKIGERSGQVKCIACEAGYYLKGTECVKQCISKDYSINLQKLEKVSDFVANYGEKTCDYLPADNCYIYGYSATNTTAQLKSVCARCKEGSSPVILSTNYKYYHLLDVSDIINFSAHPMNREPALSCENNETLFAGLAAGTAKEYCKYFYKETSNPACMKCDNGKTGKIISTSESYGGIEACNVDVNYCSSDYSFRGINYMSGNSIILSNFFSCTSCEGDRIPFLHGSIGANNHIHLKPYNLSSSPNSDVSVNEPNGNAIVCRNPLDKSDFNLADPITDFVRDCGLAVMNVDKLPTETDYLKCLSCKKGFKTVYDSSDSSKVTGCTKIENCDNSFGLEWFNSCSKCVAGFIYEYDNSNNIINYQSCIAKSDYHSNCIAGLENSSCKICEEGFTLNSDGKCEWISSYDCEDNFQMNQLKMGQFDSEGNTYYDFSTVISFNFNGQGCIKCDSQNNISLEIKNSSQRFCTQRSYIAFNEFIDGSVFIPNCLKYQGDSNFNKCSTCRDGFLIDSSEVKCQEWNSNFENCEVASSSSPGTCTTCKTGFFRKSGRCIDEIIPNCKEKSFISFFIGCSICEDGYYKSNFACYKGNVNNCVQYGSSITDCVRCEDGFHVFSDTSGKKYCIEMVDTKCLTWKTTSANSNKFECEKCISGFGPNFDTNRIGFRANMCLGPVFLNNCLVYKIDQSSPSSSLFDCDICNEGYYENNGLCEERNNLDVNCDEYDKDDDKCTTCKEGYILNNDRSRCETNPTGVDNCKTYADFFNCKACDDRFYLDSNTCFSVPVANLQEFCVEYESATRCSKCIGSNFIDANGLCQVSNADNCLSYKSETECIECIEGAIFVIKIVDEVTGDTQNFCEIETIVPNCEIQNKYIDDSGNSVYYCEQCNGGYYLSQDGCQLVETGITDCLYYSSPLDCLYCKKSKIASQDRQRCENSLTLSENGYDVDPNCLYNRIAKNPVCTMCEQGYVNISGACEPCEVSENCHTCNPADKTDCILCKVGFYMNDEGACLINSSENQIEHHDEDHHEEEEEDHHEEETHQDDKFVSIQSHLMILLFFTLTFF